MSKQTKKMYRFLAWFFTTVIAAGTLVGCKGGEPTSKYGPPPAYGYKNVYHKIVAENENGISNNYKK